MQFAVLKYAKLIFDKIKPLKMSIYHKFTKQVQNHNRINVQQKTIIDEGPVQS